MVITKTPYRISFFGGGTDYPDWYRLHGGAVLSTTINKYCYISLRELPPFFDHKHRIVYSIVEDVKHTNQIRHPAVRAVMQWAGVTNGLEIHHDGDLPARAGLGSSSSFTVGLILGLKALEGLQTSKKKLAEYAINIEQNIIGEKVGSQDQISAAYGGFNRIDFYPDNSFTLESLVLSPGRKRELQKQLMLCLKGISRIAAEIAQAKINNFSERTKELVRLREMVDEGALILQNTNQNIENFGKLLHESWRHKRSLAEQVSTPEVDLIYETALRAGAIGGKLLGAGGGGFMLLFAKPEKHGLIRQALRNLVHVPFNFENAGSRVVLYEPNGL